MPIICNKTFEGLIALGDRLLNFSMYSVNSTFRNKWLPAAMSVERALDALCEYQKVSKKIVKFHGAFIKDENDSESDVTDMISQIKARGLHSEFNIVRYNPYSSEQGVESDRIDQIASQIGSVMPVKIIPRVGFDCNASCGMFVQGASA